MQPSVPLPLRIPPCSAAVQLKAVQTECEVERKRLQAIIAERDICIEGLNRQLEQSQVQLLCAEKDDSFPVDTTLLPDISNISRSCLPPTGGASCIEGLGHAASQQQSETAARDCHTGSFGRTAPPPPKCWGGGGWRRFMAAVECSEIAIRHIYSWARGPNGALVVHCTSPRLWQRGWGWEGKRCTHKRMCCATWFVC